MKFRCFSLLLKKKKKVMRLGFVFVNLDFCTLLSSPLPLFSTLSLFSTPKSTTKKHSFTPLGSLKTLCAPKAKNKSKNNEKGKGEENASLSLQMTLWRSGFSRAASL